ncbi:MAG: 5-formyltetrahydrofolate cyclo-ligase, partial [Pseudomonadota bacterium]
GSAPSPSSPTGCCVPNGPVSIAQPGDRLGYGGGYYDATLAALKADNPAIRAVGVAYAGQLVTSLPTEDTDMPLDHILTEKSFMTTRL